MGDRVAVLKDGELQQVDSPSELYNNPVNSFVAGFIGSPAMNLMELPADASEVPGLGVERPAGVAGTLLVGVRPEHLLAAATDVNAGSGLHGEVTLVEELGADANIYAQTAVGQVTARTHDDPDSLPGIGGGVEFTLSPSARVHFFDQESGQRVG